MGACLTFNLDFIFLFRVHAFVFVVLLFSFFVFFFSSSRVDVYSTVYSMFSSAHLN